MRIRVENDSQTKIALLLLMEITGLKLTDGFTLEKYIREYGPKGTGVRETSVGSSGYAVHTYTVEPTISFEEFLKLAPELLKKGPPIKVGEYEVEFREDGVQVGCTFVEKKIVGEIYKRLYEKD